MKTPKNTVVALAFATLVSFTSLTAMANESDTRNPTAQVFHRTVKVDGLDIFYREAGPKDAPTVLLLHGFPTSSHMFRNLIPALADKYHVVAPDYPVAGAHPYKRDLKNLEFHLLDTGHFALEEDGATIAALIREFLDRQLSH